MIILYIHDFAKINKQQNCLCNSAIDDAPGSQPFPKNVGQIGIKILNVDPSPTLLFSFIVPPMLLTIRLTIAIPTPVPLLSFCNLSYIRKTFSLSACAIPMPLSVTLNRMKPSSVFLVSNFTCGSRWLSRYLIAFERRF